MAAPNPSNGAVALPYGIELVSRPCRSALVISRDPAGKRPVRISFSTDQQQTGLCILLDARQALVD